MRNMFHTIVFIALLMGPNVLITYAETYRSITACGEICANNIWAGLPKIPWIISMILTVSSYLYMTGMWAIELDEVPIYGLKSLQKYVVLSYLFFMTGAILWAPYTLISLHRREKMLAVALALWLTAIGSIGMFILACGLENQPWMVVSSLICMLHHVGFDAIYWWFTWEIQKDTAPLTKNTEKPLIY